MLKLKVNKELEPKLNFPRTQISLPRGPVDVARTPF